MPLNNLQLGGSLLNSNWTPKLTLKTPELVYSGSCEMNRQQTYKGQVIILDEWEVRSVTIVIPSFSLVDTYETQDFILEHGNWPWEVSQEVIVMVSLWY